MSEPSEAGGPDFSHGVVPVRTKPAVAAVPAGPPCAWPSPAASAAPPCSCAPAKRGVSDAVVRPAAMRLTLATPMVLSAVHRAARCHAFVRSSPRHPRTTRPSKTVGEHVREAHALRSPCVVTERCADRPGHDPYADQQRIEEPERVDPALGPRDEQEREEQLVPRHCDEERPVAPHLAEVGRREPNMDDRCAQRKCCQQHLSRTRLGPRRSRRSKYIEFARFFRWPWFPSERVHCCPPWQSYCENRSSTDDVGG